MGTKNAQDVSNIDEYCVHLPVTPSKHDFLYLKSQCSLRSVHFLEICTFSGTISCILSINAGNCKREYEDFI